MAGAKSPLPPLSFRSEDETSLDVDTAVGIYNNEPSTDRTREEKSDRAEERKWDNNSLKNETSSENINDTADTAVTETPETAHDSSDDQLKEARANMSTKHTETMKAVEGSVSPSGPPEKESTIPTSSEEQNDKFGETSCPTNLNDNTEKDPADSNVREQQSSSGNQRTETSSSEHAKTGNNGHETNRSNLSTQRESKKGQEATTNEKFRKKHLSETTKPKSYIKANDDDIDSERYTDSNTTGGRSSMGHTPRSFQKKTQIKNKNKSRSKSPKPKKNKSILRSESPKPKPLSILSSLLNDGSIYRHPTRGSSDSSVVTLPALNSTSSINKVYVDDTEKIANRYPKRDKDFKLEFVYDIRPKYPSHYVPEKKMSRREAKVFSNINGVYADYKTQDDRTVQNSKKREEGLKKIEKIKLSEEKEKRKEKIERALEQYEQLKDVREKFEILCWYRNQTQYITPRVLEHEKLSRHMYGLPESLEDQQKMIRNLRRKNKKRTRNSRVKSQ